MSDSPSTQVKLELKILKGLSNYDDVPIASQLDTLDDAYNLAVTCPLCQQHTGVNPINLTYGFHVDEAGNVCKGYRNYVIQVGDHKCGCGRHVPTVESAMAGDIRIIPHVVNNNNDYCGYSGQPAT